MASFFFLSSSLAFFSLCLYVSVSATELESFSHQNNFNYCIETDILIHNEKYAMRISIGNPPVEILALADTGSSRIWTECNSQDQDIRLYQPNNSFTYKPLPCYSNMCEPKLCSDGNCQFKVNYARNSTSGTLSTETFTLGSTAHLILPDIVFGCATKYGTVFDSTLVGIVGLGPNTGSLISQLGITKFSYCLGTEKSTKSTKIKFGPDAAVLGEGVVTIPLHVKSQYLFKIDAFSVGGERLEFPIQPLSPVNIFIDSGARMTYLPEEYHKNLLSLLARKIGAHSIAVAGYDLCYRNSSLSLVPEITVHFRDGDLKLSRSNVFMTVPQEDTVCSVFLNGGGPIIYGNIMQTNFLVGYDLEKLTLSFKPTDCTV